MSVYRKRKIALRLMWSGLAVMIIAWVLAMVNPILLYTFEGLGFLLFIVSGISSVVVWCCPHCHRQLSRWDNELLYCPYCKTPLMNEKDASNSDFGDNIGE